MLESDEFVIDANPVVIVCFLDMETSILRTILRTSIANHVSCIAQIDIAFFILKLCFEKLANF